MKLLNIIPIALSLCLTDLSQGVEANPDIKPKGEEEITSISGHDSHVFRTLENGATLKLFVAKPEGWKISDQRPCFVMFFGGGWKSGDPKTVVYWSRWAAKEGLIGIIPDYRTEKRHGTSPNESVSDGRAAVQWIQNHAKELGIDPEKVIVSGISAGGHVAAWTAITNKVPATDDLGSPQFLPAALILLNAVTDTTDSGYGGKKLFGSEEKSLACSVTHQMQNKMPPTLVFHGTKDAAVPYQNAVDFTTKMKLHNRCELITFENMGHMFWTGGNGTTGTEARKKIEIEMTKFLYSLELMESNGEE